MLPRLRLILTASSLLILVVVLGLWIRQRLSQSSTPITFEGISFSTPASSIEIQGIRFSSGGEIRVDNPGLFATLGGSQLLADSELRVHLPRRWTGYSLRFAIEPSASITITLMNGNVPVRTDEFTGEISPDGYYAEGVAIGEGVEFDGLAIHAGGGMFAIDDLGTALDNRVNAEEGAPVAVYCQIGGIEVYDLRQGRVGRLAVSITDQELAEVPLVPAENMIIAAQGDILLSRISTGEYQVNVGPDAGGNVYVYIWDTCPPTRAYNLSFNLADPSS